MIVIFSNRNKRQNNSHLSFGNSLSEELSLCTASKSGGRWETHHVDAELHGDFLSNIQNIVNNDWPWIFYIHGYNIDFIDHLEQTQGIADRHNVNIITFSWPSKTILTSALQNVSKIRRKYRRSQQRAIKTAPLLHQSFSLVNEHFLNEGQTMSLMVHSLGNYLLQQMCSQHEGVQALNNMENIVLSQADVDFDGHKQWVSQLPQTGTCYVITNYFDYILSLSNTINKVRLGQAIQHEEVAGVTYVDYTDAIGVTITQTHGAFKVGKGTNTYIHQFVYDALRGEQNLPGDGFNFIENNHAFQISARYGNQFGPASRVVGGRNRRRYRLNNHRRLGLAHDNRYL